MNKPHHYTKIDGVSEIRSLNGYERESLRFALLEEYIANHPDTSWSQQVLLDEMLDRLMWSPVR